MIEAERGGASDLKLPVSLNTAISLVVAIGLAIQISPFFTEDTFRHELARSGTAELQGRFTQPIYGSSDNVKGFTYFVTMTYPNSAEARGTDVIVTKKFYDNATPGQRVDISYDPEVPDEVYFDGQLQPMSRGQWISILAFTLFIPTYVGVSVVRRRRNR